jgi:hypothetical protein
MQVSGWLCASVVPHHFGSVPSCFRVMNQDRTLPFFMRLGRASNTKNDPFSCGLAGLQTRTHRTGLRICFVRPCQVSNTHKQDGTKPFFAWPCGASNMHKQDRILLFLVWLGVASNTHKQDGTMPFFAWHCRTSNNQKQDGTMPIFVTHGWASNTHTGGVMSDRSFPFERFQETLLFFLAGGHQNSCHRNSCFDSWAAAGCHSYPPCFGLKQEGVCRRIKPGNIRELLILLGLVLELVPESVPDLAPDLFLKLVPGLVLELVPKLVSKLAPRWSLN